MKKRTHHQSATETTSGSPKTALPADWDPFLDLLVVCGEGAESHFSDWPDGARLLFFLPEGVTQPADPPRWGRAANAGEVLKVLLAMQGWTPRRVQVLSSGDPWADQNRLRSIAEILRDALVSKQLQTNTLIRSAPIWLENAITNLPRAAARPSIEALRDAFRELPAILVSPGPSLSKNIALLEELDGRALVIAGTHALTLLAKHGVRPDIVLALDPGDLERHWEGMQPEDVGALVLCVSCNPSLFELGTLRQFVFSSNVEIDGWVFEAVGEIAYLATGGSVACSALSLAVHMGCDPITFIGQDLSFSEGRYYAEGALDSEARVERTADGSFFLNKPKGSKGPGVEEEDGFRFTRDQRLAEVPAYGGEGTVLTSEALNAFLIWFNAVCSSMSEKTFWNCTEGGARIEGTREVPLAEALASWKPDAVDATRVLEAAGAGLDEASRARKLAARVESLIEEFDPCLSAARKCRELSRGAARKPKLLASLAEAEGELKRALVPLRLLSVYAQKEIAEAQTKGRLAKDLEENLAAARQLFDAVFTGAERLQGPLIEAREALEKSFPRQDQGTT